MDRNFCQNTTEAVCIQTNKVYDTSRSKECLENLRVYFCPAEQNLVDRAISVRLRSADIIWVDLDVEDIPFNRGYYSVDIKFYFKVKLEVMTNIGGCGSDITGFASYVKKVILFGSEGNAFSFSSTYRPNENDIRNPRRTNLPVAVCELVSPVGLAANLVEVCNDHCDCSCGVSVDNVPELITRNLFSDGLLNNNDEEKRCYVTIGIFMIVRLERPTQLLIPCYDFCIPDRENDNNSDDPCALFEKFQFPLDEFFPPAGTLNATDTPGNGCGNTGNTGNGCSGCSR